MTKQNTSTWGLLWMDNMLQKNADLCDDIQWEYG